MILLPKVIPQNLLKFVSTQVKDCHKKNLTSGSLLSFPTGAHIWYSQSVVEIRFLSATGSACYKIA